MQDLLTQPSGLRIELDREIDGEFIFSCRSSCGLLLAAATGNRYSEVESRFEWMLLELGIII